MFRSIFNSYLHQLLTANTQLKVERFFLQIAIISFVIHLGLIFLINFSILSIDATSDLLKSPIAAIYTPFSFLIVYEVYLLIYYLPRSVTSYVNKQYEIILLIIMRRLFKDLSNLKISSDWFTIKYDLQFTYDLLSSLLLFYLIYIFYSQSKKKYHVDITDEKTEKGRLKYTAIKKNVASLLVPVVFILAIYSFVSWLVEIAITFEKSAEVFKNINNIFFEQFFSLLIIVDVILLLVSFFYTDQFHKVIRNSGFIISTILIRLSFTVEGVMNNILVITAVVFGLLIIVIHNKFERNIQVIQ
ncbi:hypothetical protein GENT5_13330 [Flavobacterium ammoniigenes]|jgi:hypothetical protein|uniref:Uncharacterized protein n=1 Tax=Flavobacterium ammoniigenes TaxID=1751095 RepID=A0ABN6L2M2_9FLAO|nr:hypothetical protein [Flavobacterium ammoniigenes]BDB55028.1 hypothetical protein GENT5_13330 [Flavobacterium ammoniigenes]